MIYQSNMRKLSLVLILLFLIPFVSAEINVLNQVESIYNLNERIPLKITVSSNEEIDGFIKSSFVCSNYNLDYFTTPFTFKTSPQEIDVPELKLTKNMVGTCSLEVSLSDYENILIEKKVIAVVEVSNQLILTVDVNKENFNPGDELNIDGDIKNIRGELLDTGEIKVLFDNETFITQLDNGEFSYSYKLPSNVKSNNHLLKIDYEDAYGNKASKEFSIFVIPEPTKLRTLLNNIDFLPQEKISIEALLYDQADDLMENNAEINVYDPKGYLIKKGVSKVEFELDNYASPGTWLIKTNTDDFKIESSFNVLPLKKVETYLEDGVLFIKNVGNVVFDDVLEITAIGEDGKQFTRNVKISPKDYQIVELSDELKQGIYDLNIDVGEQQESMQDVNVPESNDPLYITGRAIDSTVNNLIDKPLILALVLLVIFSAVYFGVRNKKINQFRKEKDVQMGYMRARELEQEKASKGIRPRKFNIDKKEAKDFTDQMMKKMNEKKSDDEGYLHRKERDDDNLFGNFK